MAFTSCLVGYLESSVALAIEIILVMVFLMSRQKSSLDKVTRCSVPSRFFLKVGASHLFKLTVCEDYVFWIGHSDTFWSIGLFFRKVTASSGGWWLNFKSSVHLKLIYKTFIEQLCHSLYLLTTLTKSTCGFNVVEMSETIIYYV